MTLKHLRDIAEQNGIPVAEGEAEAENGSKTAILLLKHGNHALVAIPNGRHFVFQYRMDIPPDAQAMLGKMPAAKYQELMLILRREILVGRSGYVTEVVPKTKPPILSHLRIEQRIIIEDTTPPTTQRVLDGIQELVTLGVRARQLLGVSLQAASQDTTAAQPVSTPDGMYH